MTCTLRPGFGPVTWSLQVDDDGHRTYKAKFRVLSDDPKDGPYTALQCPGLPEAGSSWAFGNDSDEWATCLPTGSVTPVVTGEPNKQWDVDVTFSTKPPPHDAQRCNDNQVGDPLLEPMKVSGGGSKYHEEATEDRFLSPILNSAFEQIRGRQIEFDKNKSTVKVEMNVPELDLQFIDSLLDCVNDDYMWGYSPRCVKFSNRHWDRKYYGQCEVYYTLSLEFEVDEREDGKSGHDRDLLDESTKALHGVNRNGQWVLTPVNDLTGEMPDPSDPLHYVQYKDGHGENARCVLDGAGVPIHGPQPQWRGSDPHKYYVCWRADDRHGIRDPDYWIELDAPPVDSVRTYEANFYPFGSMVQLTDDEGPFPQLYIWTEHEEATPEQIPGVDHGWEAITLFNRGKFNPGAPFSYHPGDYLVTGGSLGTGTILETRPGRIHVEKYDPANLFELGVPTEL